MLKHTDWVVVSPWGGDDSLRGGPQLPTSTDWYRTEILRIARRAVLLLAALSSLASRPAQAQTYRLLYSFNQQTGGGPIAQLVQDGAGNLYGNSAGGTLGEGAVFKLDPTGGLTILYSFPYVQNPSGGLVLDAVGNLYGTADSGFNVEPPHCGYLFKVDPAGQETALYTFSGGADGCQPSFLIRDSDGNLYGATEEGGDPGCFVTSPVGCGTIFKVDSAGQETTLYAFEGNVDGISPVGLIRDAAGNFYGATRYGGPSAHQPLSGFGTVFKLDTTGTKTTLYSFTNGADGAHPNAGVVEDGEGNLYGTTAGGGSSGTGTVFKLDTTGRFSVLYSFPKSAGPLGGLILDDAGNLYGTAENSTAVGIVFELDPTGTETVVHTFSATEGGYPNGGLLLGAAGNLYGATPELCCDMFGSPIAWGTIFEISPDFSLTASALMPSTVSPGASSSAAVTIAPVLPFSQEVTLSCSVQPAPALAPKCSVGPSSATPGTPVTLTVTTTETAARMLQPSSGSGLIYALSLPMLGVVAGIGGGSERKRRLPAFAFMLLLTGLVFGIACGGGGGSNGGGNGGTPAGTYTITVTGTAGPLQHSTTTTVTVQ